MNKLYEKYLNWRLNKTNSEIELLQSFIPDTSLSSFSYYVKLDEKYVKLNRLTTRRSQLLSKLNSILPKEQAK
jgi:hypothetical protein